MSTRVRQRERERKINAHAPGDDSEKAVP